MAELEGKVAVVTGAGRGLGRAIAEELAGSGAKVVVNYSRSKEPAEEVVEGISGGDEDRAVAIQADVSDAEQASRLIEETMERFGRIDVLVNNAGINVDKTMKKMEADDWNTVIQVDLNSCYYTVKAAMSHMLEQESGTIVNVSSFVGQTGNFGQANYSAAKAGIIGFTKSIALEFARYGITANAICPGFVDTDMLAGVPEDVVKERILPKIPLGRIGSPQEVAKAVRYLVVDGDYITGQTLNINGGIFMQ